jgi:hypothetical protein
VALDFTGRRVYLCGFGVPFPFKAGDKLLFQVQTFQAQNSVTSETLTVSRESDGTQLVLGRGDSMLLPLDLGGSRQTTPVAGCLGQRIECGGLARPAQLDTLEQSLRSGDTLNLDGIRFTLLSARYQPVYDSDCTPSLQTTASYLEWAAVLTDP